MLGLEEVLAHLNVKGEKPTPEQLAQAQYKLALSTLRSLIMEARRLPGIEAAVQAVEGRIQAAEALVAKGGPDKARAALGDSEKVLQLALGKGRELQQQQIRLEEAQAQALRKSLREREPYAATLLKARRVLLALRRLPGAEAQAGALDKLIEQAEKLADAGQHGDARTLLEEGGTGFFNLGANGIGDLLVNGKEASGKRVAAAQKTFAPAFQKRGQVLKMLDGDKYLHPRLRAQFGADLERALQPLFAEDADRHKGQVALDRLAEIEQHAKAAILTANGLFGMADKLVRGDVEQAFGALSGQATPADRADLVDRRQQLKSLMEQHEYQAALDAGSGFVDDCQALNAQVAAAAQAWQRDKGRLDAIAGDCRRWIDSPLPMLADARPTPASLQARVEQLQAAAVGEQMSFAQAHLLLTSIGAEHEALQARVKANAELAEHIAAGEQRIQAALRGARDELQKLLDRADRSVRKQTGNPLDSAGGHGPRIDALATRWAHNKAAAVAETDLQVDAIEAELQQVAQALKGAVGVDAYLRLLGEEQTAAARREYATQRQVCVRLLEKLRPWGSPRQEALQQALEVLDRRAAEAADETELRRHGLDPLRGLADEIRLADSEAASRRQALEDEGRQLVAAIVPMRQAFEDTLTRYGKSFLTESPQYAAYHEQLGKDFSALQGQLAERDVDIVAAVVADLRALKRRVDEGRTALEGRSLPAGAPTLEAIDKRLQQARADLGTTTLSEFLASTATALKTQLGPIEAQKLTRPIDVSLDALALWQRQLDQALVEASKAARDYAAFERDLEGVRQTLDGAKRQFADQPKFLAALKTRLTACLAEGKSEGLLAEARKTLEALRTEIERALKDPEAMKAGQQQAALVESLKKDDEARWQGLYEVFSSQTLPQVRRLADPALAQEVARLGTLAQQSFSKTGDLDWARQQLRLASDRAQDAIAYPGGKALHFRRALAPAEARWRQAVTAFGQQLDALVAAVEQAEPAHGAATQAAAQAVKNLFQGGAFQACVARMNSPGASPDALRAAREDGLAQLRRYRQTVQAHPQMVALSGNPFMRLGALLELNNALFELERNLLVSA